MSKTPIPKEPPYIGVSDLRSGDVLLCYSSQMEGQHVEVSGYSHVAICVDAASTLHADGSRVVVCPATDLLDNYDHLAVLRNPSAWRSDTIQKLQEFATNVVGASFNRIGMARLPDRLRIHAETVMTSLNEYFNEGKTRVPSSESFFCSQLVAEALAAADVITESGSIVIDPQVATPLGISLDRVYGNFIGYVVRPNYRVPANDRMRRQWT